MKTPYNLLKIFLKKVLPIQILNSIKKRHYLNTLKDFNLENEPDLILSLKLINKDDFVIDIGANIGIYTKSFSEFVGKNGQVVSIEPIPITFDFLNNNIEKLKLLNVETFNYAISNDDNIRKMVIPVVTAGENYFRARITEEEVDKELSTSYSVKSIKLDDLIDTTIKYSFIKIDVEGHEENVILGSQKVIGESLPILLIEIEGNLDDSNTTAGRVKTNLDKFGYEVYFNENQKLRKWKAGDISINYFFIPPNSISIISELGLTSAE